VRKFAIVPAVALVLSVTAFAQDPIPQLPPPQDPESRAEAPAPAPQTKFRSGTSMVALNVTVTDGRKLVTGLTQDHFEVYEDGVRQQVRFFEARSVPMDVILLLDTSSSMREKMPIVHEAARGFMRLLRQNDRGAVVAFNEKVTVLQELTSDTAAIERAIGSAEAKGSTALHNALYVALKQFGRPASGDGEIRRQAIAVLSDGEDTSSVVAFDDVVALARKTGVSIYPIALQSQFAALRAASDRRYFSESDHAMRTLAKETGAQRGELRLQGDRVDAHARLPRERPAVLLGVGPRDAHPREGDRRAGVLPDDGARPAGGLRLHRRGARGAVLDRVLAVEQPRRRPVPPDHRAGDGGSDVPAAGARRLHGRRLPRGRRWRGAATAVAVPLIR